MSQVARIGAPLADRHPDRALARPHVDAADITLIRYLRRLACRARLSGPLDIDRACAMIAPADEIAAETYGRHLLRALDSVAIRPVIFHAGSSAPPSFDEIWLLRIVRLFAAGDDSGARFLIAGRVPRQSRRAVGFLAAHFGAALAQGKV